MPTKPQHPTDLGVFFREWIDKGVKAAECLSIIRRRNLAAFALIAAISVSAQAQNASDATAGVSSSTTASADSTRPRPRAIEYSDAYATRLKIHRIGSYAELPLFAAEWYLGDKLMQQNQDDWVNLHTSL